MPSPLIKICGITTETDALSVSRLPIHAVGFVFYPPSPRFVTPETAKRLAKMVRAESEAKFPSSGGVPEGRGIVRVGVFVDESVERMTEIARFAGLNVVQLHGRESAETAKCLREAGFSVIRSVRPEDFAAVEARYAEILPAEWMGSRQPPSGGEAPGDDHSELLHRPEVGGYPFGRWPGFMLLVETSGGKMPGGGGIPWDWRFLETLPEPRFPVLLAGGVSPENAEEIRKLRRISGIDVSSGVEESPGRKSVEKIRRLLAELERWSI